MEVRRMNMNLSSHERNTNGGSKTVVHHGRQMGSEYDNRNRMAMISKPKSRSSYFSLESMVVLVGLAASLLILPLILPPLPPPPFMLLLLPLCIFGVLMVFAIMPSSSAARHKSERLNQ
nr:ARGOS-like protein [Tanacetum cinerariifolium]